MIHQKSLGEKQGLASSLGFSVGVGEWELC
jgi:hypothetical protein